MNRDQRSSAVWRFLFQAMKLAAVVAVVGFGVHYFRSLPVAVTASNVTQDAISAEVMGTGTLEARVKATISPKISGRIAEVLVDQGDEVTAGQLLVRLDDNDLRQKVKMGEASIARAEATVSRFEAEKEQADSTFQQAEADFRRGEKLNQAGALSQAEFDEIRKAFLGSKSGIAGAEAGLAEAKQAVQLARQSLKYDEARLADAQIVAPFDGLIVERFRDPGSIAVPGTPVLSLISLDELWISAWVDETAMGPLQPGQGARVIFRSAPERSFSGKVTRLGKQADRETREFTVDVRVLELPDNWAIGQRAEVYIQTDRVDNATVVPAEFVRLRDGRPGVYVARDTTAHWRPIRLGITGRDQVQVIEGLSHGDTVVIPTGNADADLDGREIVIR